MLIQEIIFLIFGIIIAIVFSALGFPNAVSIICSFLPVVISIFCENIEKINLIFTKVVLINRTVSVKASVKNTFTQKNGLVYNSVDYDPMIFEEMLKKALMKKQIAIGCENNTLRIEGNQRASYGKDKNICIKVPVLVYIQLSGQDIVCTLKNSSESIAYRDVRDIIRNLDFIWDFINEQFKEVFECNQENAFYEAIIKINTSKFKDVYLKTYAQKQIKNVEIVRNNARIKLNSDSMTISSASESSFEKAIKKYNGLFGKFFDEE